MASEVAVVDFRAEIAKLIVATIADEAAHGNYLYDPIRPDAMPPRPYKVGTQKRGDCSKYAQWTHWWVDAPEDPMGMNWGPYGNSQTLCAHLPHLAKASQLLLGDIVTVGEDGDEHACVVMEVGSDPIVGSFGHQGAPNEYNLSHDSREPKQFLRTSIPHYQPTPADKLRASTGYWSWVQWRLAEGAWRNYPVSDERVRPNVPKKISDDWWDRYDQFVANRHKGNVSNGPPAK